MIQREKQLVQDSWSKIIPISDNAAELFYQRLFEMDPSLKSLFKSDMTEQGRKLMTMIKVAVNGLDNLDEIVEAARSLGKRHSTYGVKDEHYDTVATALLCTLERCLADAFTEETRSAWISTYTLLATTMKQAAAEPAAV